MLRITRNVFNWRCVYFVWPLEYLMNKLPVTTKRATVSLIKVKSYIALLLMPLVYNTYLLTPWCRVLLEKLTGLQLVKKSLAFHGTRRFITALTSVRHLSLSWASPIQSIYPHPTSWRSILILSTHLRLGLPSGLLPSGFPTKTLYTPFSSPICATYPAHLMSELPVLGRNMSLFQTHDICCLNRVVFWLTKILYINTII